MDLVVAAGASPGPRSIWLGAWVLKHGYGAYKPFFEACRRDGVRPLVIHWWLGDDLSLAALRGPVQDRHQGVTKTSQQGIEAAGRVAKIAREAGVVPIVVIESEWNKGDVLTAAARPELLAYLEGTRRAVKDAHPGAECVFAPGAWGDLKALALQFRSHATACDQIGLQAVKFPPRHTREDIHATAETLRRGFDAIWGVVGDKPCIIHDLAVSTYAGGSSSHPFAGGDGRARDAEQARVLAEVLDLDAAVPSLWAVVLREVKDDGGFTLSNWGGWAERHVGYVRADGSKKPSMAVLETHLAKAKAPDEDEGRGDLEAVVAALGMRVDDVEARLRDAARSLADGDPRDGEGS